MRDDTCFFNDIRSQKCKATTREFCTGCTFRATEDEYKASRQASFDRWRKLGAAQTGFDREDIRLGVITEGAKV